MDERARLRYGVVAPPSLPIWGSIIDDRWVLECEEAGREPCGPSWLSRATARWGALGAEVNDMKTVDAETDQEIQGYWVDGRDSWLGVSVAKRVGLYFATLDLLRVWRPPVKDVESVVGKFGFVHSARPELRSIFGITFRWIDDARRNGSKRLPLPAAVVCELLVAALSLPFASLPIDA